MVKKSQRKKKRCGYKEMHEGGRDVGENDVGETYDAGENDVVETNSVVEDGLADDVGSDINELLKHKEEKEKQLKLLRLKRLRTANRRIGHQLEDEGEDETCAAESAVPGHPRRRDNSGIGSVRDQYSQKSNI